MTYAPATLIAARNYVLGVFDTHPGVTVGADLDPAEVGIVAGKPCGGGYHQGRSGLHCADRAPGDTYTDYSWHESPRDLAGLTDAASAVDIGEFTHTFTNGTTVTLRHLSLWLVHRCEAGTTDTADIREIIYTPDGVTVKRWDRLRVRSTGDDSHLTHTHISLFRDAEGRYSLLNLLKHYVDTFGATTAPEGEPVGILIKLLPNAVENRTWYADGGLRYALTPGEVTGKQELHRAGLLPLLNSGNVYTIQSTDPVTLDGWGVDLATLALPPLLTDAQVAAEADRIATQIAPAITPLVTTAVRQAIDGTTLHTPQQ